MMYATVVLTLLHGVAYGGFVRRVRNDTSASGLPDLVFTHTTSLINSSNPGRYDAIVGNKTERVANASSHHFRQENVSVSSDHVTLVKSYHVGQHRDLLREHYRDNFSTAPTHMIYEPARLANLLGNDHQSLVELSNTSDESSLKGELVSQLASRLASQMASEFASELSSQLVSKLTSELELKKSTTADLDDLVTGEDNATHGWISKACFFVGDSASRSPQDDPMSYPDLSDVCKSEVIGKNSRCCVCPNQIKAVRSGKNTLFTKGQKAREQCAELGKGWLHEGGLCLKSLTMMKTFTSLGSGKGC
jgi:hypothetical protein